MSQNWQDTLTAADLSLEVSRRSSISQEAPVLTGYEIQEVLGSGAFGRVYRAVQKSTNQVVAVKVLFVVTDGLKEEVRRLSQVSDHPNIVTLVDADLENEPPYLVTPYLAGSLAGQVPENVDDVNIERVVRWFEELARALQFVHGRGILHCDVKPANVLLGEDDQARLVDFGQSVALDDRELRLGSFWFMPPEQAQLPGSGAEVPHVGWDLYALGATIYSLLTGRPPLASNSARETLGSLQSGREKLERYQELARASVLIPVQELNPRVDRELAAIVEACLRRRGRPTYESASELVADLKRRRENLPVKAWPSSHWYNLQRFVARHRLSVTVAGLALGLLMAGFTWASHRIYQADKARQALIIKQYERGLGLLEKGRTSGLVWLVEACRQSPSEPYRRTLQEKLSDQLTIAAPKLYRVRTTTAPSPSGTRGIIKDPESHQRVLIDLTNGTTSPLPSQVQQMNLSQKDNVRYLLDDVVLDPERGTGGPAIWRLPPFDSVSPVHQEAALAILVRPELVLQVKRSPKGFRVFDSSGDLKFSAESESFSPSAPTFSLQGDLAVGWEDGTVEVYPRDQEWKARTVAQSYTELLCFSPRGDRLAGHDGESKVTVWDTTGRVLAEFELGATANEMAFDESGDLLVCVTRDALVHGYDIDRGQAAWSPAEMEKAALWVFVQPGGQIVTMSDEVIVWKPPGKLNEPLQSLEALTERVALRTGWVYDDNARVRTLTRDEYRLLFNQD